MDEQFQRADSPELRASDADRERVAQILHRAMGEGRLDVGELEERLATLYAAKTIGELAPLTADLPVPSAHPPAIAAQRAVSERIGGTPTSSTSIAILSGADRRGPWVVPPRYTAVAIMGGVDLDLTEARFSERETVIYVVAIMGGVDIIVPEDVNVRVDGVGILGAFDNRAGSQAPEGSPLVRVTGIAVMGGVDVKPPKRKHWGRRVHGA
ncbi:MAG: DUF1707 SHOCT-like domain-containing protein [Sciscionella sp.]